MKRSTLMGEYRHFDTCRFCFSSDITPVLHLGNMPLAGGFIKDKRTFENEKNYPLELFFCQSCFLLQCANTINPDTLFKEYFYISSSITTLTNHFYTKAKLLKKEFPDSEKRFIVEIGCNDGGFITALQQQGFKALGVDPASNIVTPLIKKGVPIINEFFDEKLGKKISDSYGKADAVYSFHALAHIEDMHEVVKGIQHVLKKDGYLAFEVHYLGNLIQEFQYDMIYHEHQFYYSLLALKKFFEGYDMEIYDVHPQQIRAGSMMYYIQKKHTGKRRITENVKKLLVQEKKVGLHKSETFVIFNEYISKTKRELRKLLSALKKANKVVAGYGASGRGTVIMNYCNLDKGLLTYVIDDSPVKQGAFTPGNHLEIVSSAVLNGQKSPDYVVLFAWPFVEEIKKKNQQYLQKGGKFIIPLPKVSILEYTVR